MMRNIGLEIGGNKFLRNVDKFYYYNTVRYAEECTMNTDEREDLNPHTRFRHSCNTWPLALSTT